MGGKGHRQKPRLFQANLFPVFLKTQNWALSWIIKYELHKVEKKGKYNTSNSNTIHKNV